MMQSGGGVKKTFFKTKAPTKLEIGRSVSLAPSTISVYNIEVRECQSIGKIYAPAPILAPSTISVYNNGKVQYRGEKTIQDGSGFFSSAQYFHRNPGMGGKLKRKQIKCNKCINEIN